MQTTFTVYEPSIDELYPRADAVFAGTLTAAAASKPVATIPQLANYLISGFWQYVGEIPHHWGTSTISYNIQGLTALEKSLAQSALNAWHEVANINFVQSTGTANITFSHNGSMQAYESDNFNSAGIMSSATIVISQDWITTDGGANDGKIGIDSYGYQTYIHEIGHALGLGHQGPYNGSASYSGGATYANDTWQYSVMSYFSEPNYDGSSYRYVITPQMADIYAVQQIYGAASTRTGDTVYGFNNTAGAIFNFASYVQAPALTIYDSGGNDTLDASGYANAQTIDLHSGAFSSIGGLVRNIGISTTTIVEKAIGGSGNDTLIASDLGSTLLGGSGNDTLTGGAGADRLTGGAGIDTMTGGGAGDIFVIAAGDASSGSGAHDLINDFTVGTDRIDLTGYDADAGTPGVLDAFRFLSNAALDGIAAALNYVFDSVRNATVLQGDTNGDGQADFAVDLKGNLILTSADFTAGSVRVATPLTLTGDAGNNTLNGDVLNDTLSGLGGDDTLNGLAGNDALNGGTGADIMVGGAGDDSYVVDNAGDVVTENSSFVLPSGWTLRGTADFNKDGQLDVAVTSATVGEIWTLNNGVVTATYSFPGAGTPGWTDWYIAGIADLDGDGDKDLIYQNTTLPGTRWQNAIYLNGVVQTGGSTISGRIADPLQTIPGSGGGTDLVTASISYTLQNGAENLTLAAGAGALSGTGNASANGAALDDTLSGLGGNDTLNGFAGNDTLDGGTGADAMTGGAGNDTYVVDNAGDTVNEGSGGGTDTVIASISTTLVAAVENLTLAAGAGALSGTGNAAANVIVGNESDNVITGRGGADTLTGGLAADTFTYADGDSGAATGARDLITDFAIGTDKLDLVAMDASTQSAGDDAFRFLGSAAFDGQAAALHTVYDASRNVTVLEGDNNGDRVADFAIELAGNKALTTADFSLGSLLLPLSLTGTAGGETLNGATLDDTLSGLGGNDTLNGFPGNDTLDGGTGADAMTGGTGNDTYIVDNAGDTITESTAFTVPSDWTLRGTADFNKDGQLDVVVTNTAVGEIWLLDQDGGVLGTHSYPGSGTPGWTDWYIAGIADLGGDGDKDLIYQNTTLPGTRWQNAIYLDGVTQTGGSTISGRIADPIQPIPGSNGGTDSVVASVDYTLPAGTENLTLASGAGAIGGTGNVLANAIVGNEGNNLLSGLGGNDTLTGNAGRDTFLFKAGFGKDAVTDFHAGEDFVQFDAGLFASVSDIFAHTTDVSGSAVIALDAANSVTIQGVTSAELQLHQSGFHIV